MPAMPKHPSVRSRRNRSATRATLTRIAGDPVPGEAYVGWTVDQLRTEVDRRNGDGRPGDRRIRRSGNKAALTAALAADDSPARSVPRIPDHPRSDWHPQTREWWAAVWGSPMSAEWDDSDTHNVGLLALLFDDALTADTATARRAATAEFRMQRADLGLSPMSRRKLEWTIETADEAKDRGRRRRGNGRTAVPPSREATKDPRAHFTGDDQNGGGA